MLTFVFNFILIVLALALAGITLLLFWTMFLLGKIFCEEVF